jgi:ribosome modulation factor
LGRLIAAPAVDDRHLDDAGVAAHNRGIQDCPYRAWTAENLSWLGGWYAARDKWINSWANVLGREQALAYYIECFGIAFVGPPLMRKGPRRMENGHEK